MSARSTFIHLAAKAGILFGALFLVSVLLAAIPGHRAPAVPVQDSQQSSSQPPESQPMDHSKMSGMEMDDAKANEAHAARIPLHKLLERVPRSLLFRSRAPDFPALQKNFRRVRVGWRHVHHAQARD